MKKYIKNLSDTWMWIPAFCFFMLPAALMAGEVTLAWDSNQESDLAGYKLYYDGDSDSEMYQGTGATEGDSPVVIYLDDLPDTDSPTFTLTGLEDGEFYYFALTAFNTNELESAFSDEVGAQVGLEDTSSDTSSEASGGSGSTCFISGTMGERAGNLPRGSTMVFLFLATAIAACTGSAWKRVTAIRQIQYQNDQKRF